MQSWEEMLLDLRRRGLRGCRRCTRVLEGARGGLAKDARPTLLGAQDRKCFEQVAEEPTGKGQARIGADLDGRDQEGCSHRIQPVRRNLHIKYEKAVECLP